MKKSSACFALLLHLFVFRNACLAQHILSVGERTAKVDSFLTVLASHQLFNGSILVSEQGKIIYQKSFGFADFAYGTKNTDTTHFNLASLSKPITATAILQLVQTRKLKFDDPVSNHLPDFPYQDLTVRHLLNQTSGLPILEKFESDYINEHPDEIIDNQKAYAHLVKSKKPLMFSPGSDWRYNNTNYLVLALLVEKLSGVGFDVYMQKNIFGPAGMKNTYVRQKDLKNTTRYTRPNMYDPKFRNVDSLDRKQDYTYYNLGGIVGSNNIVSTVQDLWKFDQAFTEVKLISKEMIEVAFTPVTLNNGKVFHMGASTRSYGLGWNVYTSKTEPVNKFAFHDGHIVGLSTVLHKNFDHDQTIILYDNIDNNPIQIMISVSNILLGTAPPKIRLTSSAARLYGELLVSKGIDYATSKFNELKADSVSYHVDEFEINRLGYDFMRANSSKYLDNALEVFRLNTTLFLNSGNAYDSYAQALSKAGKREEAIVTYQKSIILSPGNEEGKKALQKLLEERH